jgi:hypothetical protein
MRIRVIPDSHEPDNAHVHNAYDWETTGGGEDGGDALVLLDLSRRPVVVYRRWSAVYRQDKARWWGNWTSSDPGMACGNVMGG